MSEPLKACECGDNAGFVWSPGRRYVRATCLECPASTGWHPTREAAIAAWNCRAPVPLPSVEDVLKCWNVHADDASDTYVIADHAAHAVLALLEGKK